MRNTFCVDNKTGKVDPRLLRQDGPLIDAQIEVPSALAAQLAKAGKPIPQPQVVKALIDTGAASTSVDSQVIANLGLQVIGQITLCTPSHAGVQAGVYAAKLTFPSSPGVPVHADPINVISCTLSSQGIGALLGRDFLSRAVLIYNGPGGFFTLAF